MAGRYKDIPPNIQKRLKALFGISFEEWLKVKYIIDESFDKKKEEAAKGFKIDSEKDISNSVYLKF
jgi:hypothetical protein